LLAATLCAAACAQPKVYRIKSIDFPHSKHVLDNGLRVVVQPDHSVPNVSVVVRYQVGAAADPKGKRGLAHLTEHLAFQIDSKAPGYIGYSNAHTSLDETVYKSHIAPQDLEAALIRHAEHMGGFSATISEDVFENERQVIRNERRQNYEHNRSQRWWWELYEHVFPSEHPYSEKVIGSHKSINAITFADFRQFIAKHYHPANATLVVVGPVDPRNTLPIIKRLFAGKPKQSPFALQVPTFTPQARREVITTENGDSTVIVAWPIGRRYSDDADAMAVLGQRGWFWYRIKNQKEWAHWVWSGVLVEEEECLFAVRAVLQDPQHIDAVVEKIFEIASLLDRGFDFDERQRKSRHQGFSSLLDSEYPIARATDMARFFSAFGDPIGWKHRLSRTSELSVETIREAGRRLLKRDRALVLIHKPKAQPVEIATGDAQKKKKRPPDKPKAVEIKGSTEHEKRRTHQGFEFGQSLASYQKWAAKHVDTFSEAEAFQLSNGIRCRVYKRTTFPLTHLRISFPGGALTVPAKKSGLYGLMFSTMSFSGSADRSRYSSIRMRTDPSVYAESAAFDARFLSPYANDAIRLIAERLSSPRFTRKNLGKAQATLNKRLQEDEIDLRSLAWRAQVKQRGLDSIFGLTTKSTLENVTLNDIYDHHERFIYPENALISIVSSMPVESLRPILEEHFGDWDYEQRKPIEISELMGKPQSPRGDVILVDVPTSPQTQLSVTYDSPGWIHWKKSLLADAVGILLEEKSASLRQAMGITYGSHVNIRSFRNFGLLHMHTIVDAKASQSGVDAVLQIIETLSSAPVTAGELDYVKRQLFRYEAAANSSFRGLASRHAYLMGRYRHDNFQLETLRFIEQITKEQIEQAAKELLSKPPTMVLAGPDPEFKKSKEKHFAPLKGAIVRYSTKDLLE